VQVRRQQRTNSIVNIKKVNMVTGKLHTAVKNFILLLLVNTG